MNTQEYTYQETPDLTKRYYNGGYIYPSEPIVTDDLCQTVVSPPVVGRISGLTYKQLHEDIYGKDRLYFLEREIAWKDKELAALFLRLEKAEQEIDRLRNELWQ